MSGILMTQQSGILKYVAIVLGWLMNSIFLFLDRVGIPNIGLSIIIFTVIIYVVMAPLTVKQQMFSKLSAKMNPEIKAIQKKYAGRKDNESVMAMNQETQAVYAKYGVSPTGSCLQLLIQMPILFALYRVIYSMPAYVQKIKDVYSVVATQLVGNAEATELIKNFSTSKMYAKQFTNELFVNGDAEYITNTFIDCLNKASTSDWATLAQKFPNISADIEATLKTLNQYNNFCGLNIANSPLFTITDSFKNGHFLMIIAALIIPFLAAATQWLNVKLMPQPDTSGSDDNGIANSMKTMNTMMPLMSAFFCVTLPAGMGIYWIAGAVVRSIMQVIINKHIDKMDFDKIMEKNKAKAQKKLEKKGKVLNNNTSQYASLNTKANVNSGSRYTAEEKEAALKKANDYYNKGLKADSIAAKANLVRKYNENNRGE